jgi:glyoxylase-like metal-dependent hydrolase (beta-lactamase superfamily II)
MKRTAILAAVVVAGGAIAAAAQQFPPIGGIDKVSNNLYVVPGQGGNTAVFVTARGVVLVDTKLANNGQAILDQVRTVTSNPVTTIINTHVHDDHTGSNRFFPEAVDILAHANTRSKIPNMEALSNPPAFNPDRTYKDRMTVGEGADRVELYHFGPGHTNGDTLVVFPGARAMHAGDLFAWKSLPYIDEANGGSGVSYPDTLEKAAKGIVNVDSVITGHMSTVMAWADFIEYGEFNREFLRATEAAHRAGRTIEQAAAELKLPARFDDFVGDGPIPGLEFLGPGRDRVAGNVKVIYDELNGR